MKPNDAQLLRDLLRDTSRSFYLTLRILPGSVRFQIGLAYLLARISDTIADTTLVPVEKRLAALNRFQEKIAGRSRAALDFGAFAEQQGDAAEKRLLLEVETALRLLTTLSQQDQQRVRSVLATITSGQELDLKRFGGGSAESILALAGDDQLDDYTWRVAGCVGQFWTQICRAHVFPNAKLDMDRLLEQGVRFGKGLQLVNILRDLPRDLRQGRCYVPKELLRPAGLSPEDLKAPENMPRFRPVYDSLLDRADRHLAQGWQYTLTLPRSAVRVRLACAWPVLIGQETLKRLRQANVLDAAQRVKVDRSQLRGILVRSVVLYPVAGKWAQLGQPTTVAARM